MPGTTRDLITESVDIEGLRVTLVDTAGLREDGDLVEREGIARSRGAAAVADLKLLVLDGSRPLEEDEEANLEATGPQVIVALGKFAVQTLLRTKAPITKLRGQWFDYQGIKLMPTFHPAYLLRNPAEKRVVWSDIKAVMAELALPVPRR